VTGWQAAEYEQMSLWPGNAYFGYRYDYAEEYVQIMKELWANGKSDLKGMPMSIKRLLVSVDRKFDRQILHHG